MLVAKQALGTSRIYYFGEGAIETVAAIFS